MSKTKLHTYTQKTKEGQQNPEVSNNFKEDWKNYLNIDLRRYTRGILNRDNELYIIESLGSGTYAVALIKDIGGRGDTILSRVVIEANKKVEAGCHQTIFRETLWIAPRSSPIYRSGAH